MSPAVQDPAEDPASRRCYLGVDAGNSKTVAVVVDTSGSVVGYGRSGRGDIYSTATEELAVAEVVTAVRQAFAMTRATGRFGPDLDESSVCAAAFCLAGLDWPADFDYWHAALARELPGLRRYRLMNDGFALLRAGEPAGRGVALSAGTGGAVVARGDRDEWSASFWVVDALGGWALGSHAYAAVVRAELGIGPPTRLREVVLERHGYADVADLLERTTSRGAAIVHHARLARDVLDAARTGDPVAAAIVEDQAVRLAQYARAASLRVGLSGSSFTAVLGGSVLSSENPALYVATVAALGRVLPDARPVLTPRSPVVGAAAEALSGGDVPLSDEVLARLTTFAFPSEFLLT